MYKIVKSLNRLLLVNRSTNFHKISYGDFCQREVDNCANGSARLNKMVAMFIYGKTPKIFFSRIKKALRLNLGLQNGGLKVYHDSSNSETRMTFEFLTV